MIKRSLAGLFCISCLVSFIGGCYKPLPVTDNEMDMVAEYAASVLVKYGTDSEEILYSPVEQERYAQLTITPTPRPIKHVTNTPVPTKGASGEPTPTQKAGSTPTLAPTLPAQNSEQTMLDLSELFGKDGFYFDFVNFKITSDYYGSGDMFACADKKKKLVVLEFDITNESGQSKTLEMSKKVNKENNVDFIFTLRMGDYSYRPLLTLLNEDLYTSYKENFTAGETKKGVIIFECEEDKITDCINLTILRVSGDKEDSVILKVR